MAKERLTLYDKYGNVIEYDISAASITIDAEGKQLDIKLTELADTIAAAIKSVTFNGNSPSPDNNGNVNLGQQMQADWDENNPEWPSYIRNKPSLANVATSGDYNDLRNKPTIPEGAQTDSQMSDTSEAPVQNKVIKAYVDAVSQRIDTLIGSGNVQGAIDTFNEMVAFLNGINSNETLAAKLLLKADKSTTYTKTETDNAIANAVEGLGGGSVESVSVNGGEPQLPDQNGNIDIESVDGITPHIDVVTGHWFIGDEDTNIPASGPQGNSGYTGAVGELEVVNNLTDGGAAKALSAEQGKLMAIQSIPDAGTFGDAYDKAKDNNVVFPWLLRDVDKQGNSVTKMIWHVGNREFVDAIGAKIDGKKNGVIITTNAPCYLKVWHDASNTDVYPLASGENVLSFDDIKGANQQSGASQYHVNFFTTSEATTEDKASVVSIDFGGLVLTGVNMPLLNGMTSLKSVSGLVFNADGSSAKSLTGLCKNCSAVESVEVSGYYDMSYSGNDTWSGLAFWFNGAPSLFSVDLANLEVKIASSFYGLNLSGYIRTLDIRKFDLRTSSNMQNAFRNRTFETLVIGEHFSNENVTTLNADQFAWNNNINTIVCVSDTPPMLKLTDTSGGSAVDVDWVSVLYNKSNNKNGFSILVPPGCGETYKQASGWSEHSSIISEYNEGDY